MNIVNPQEVEVTAIRDRIFKEIFFDERNMDLLICLVETCLGIKISEVKYLNNELPQGNYQIKGKRLDLLLNTDIGKINIELNSEIQPYTYARNFSYVCNIYLRNTEVGNDYSEDVKVIQINLTFGLGVNPPDEDEEEVYNTYEVIKRNNKIRRLHLEDKKYVENLIIYEFNMDKIMEFWYSKNEEMISKYKYLIMLGLSKKELEKLNQNDERVVKYMEAFDKVTVSIGINDWISEEEDKRRILNTEVKLARKEALKEGIEQGIEQGIEKGIEQGIEQNKLQTILNLNALNVPLDVIAKANNLTVEEVEKIIKDNKKEDI